MECSSLRSAALSLTARGLSILPDSAALPTGLASVPRRPLSRAPPNKPQIRRPARSCNRPKARCSQRPRCWRSSALPATAAPSPPSSPRGGKRKPRLQCRRGRARLCGYGWGAASTHVPTSRALRLNPCVRLKPKRRGTSLSSPRRMCKTSSKSTSTCFDKARPSLALGPPVRPYRRPCLGFHPPNVDGLGMAFQPRGAVDKFVEPRPARLLGSGMWGMRRVLFLLHLPPDPSGVLPSAEA